MIWNGDQSSPSDPPALAAHLASEVARACPDLDLPADRISQAAHAVANYCLGRMQATCLPSDCLSALMSRSLAGIGEREASERMLADADGAGGRHELLTRSRCDAAVAWRLSADRVVRSSWYISQSGETWVIDLGAVAWGVDGLLEMSVLQGLRLVVANVADVWDAGSGAGCLGLRGIAATRVAARELKVFAEAVLERIGCARGWACRPRVVCLEL